MRYHYVWLVWASAFLVPWLGLYLANPALRRVMQRTSLATALFGLTEPIFVPAYWNPPSLFELAQRTRFDIESIIFSFAIGGIGAVAYGAVTRAHLVRMPGGVRHEPWHRFHRAALLLPPAVFVPLALLPWNPIYPAMASLALGGAAAVACRPRLAGKTLAGGLLFAALYAVFMLGLSLSAPGYIGQVWNLAALSGGVIGGIPVEELLFGAAFGLYWTSVFEHLTWRHSVPHEGGP